MKKSHYCVYLYSDLWNTSDVNVNCFDIDVILHAAKFDKREKGKKTYPLE